MKKGLLFLILSLWAFAIFAQQNYVPTAENINNRKLFQDAKFGLFIHWGVYSVLGDGEWIMHHRKFNKEDYARLPQFFNPVDFNAKEWVNIAKSAGMKYIVITSRHHDGFSMFKTVQSPYNIVDASPFKRDVLKELAEACREGGIKLGFYYSHLDWYHNDYFPRGNNQQSIGRPNEGNWNNYLQFMNNQLTELLTNYGDVFCIWFDGWWDKPSADWKLDEQYDVIHKLQPSCLIGNNHHRAIKPGEDFQMFEKDLPGHNTTGFSKESEVGQLPLEMCETMNGSWGFNITDRKYKTSTDLIKLLVKSAGYNSNLLLNVGPMPNGKIQVQNIDTLAKIGKWLSIYGETVYGTRQGLLEPSIWGVSTMKDKMLYLHILDWKDQSLLLSNFSHKINKVYAFKTKESISYIQNDFGLSLRIPQSLDNEVDKVIVIELK